MGSITNRKAGGTVWFRFLGSWFIALLALGGCVPESSETQDHEATPSIAILQYGTHPVIDAVVDGFRGRMQILFGDRATITSYNANFDLTTAGTLSKQMVVSDADILISVTTPASGQLIGANRGEKPLVFTFVSEPADLGYSGPGTLPSTTGLSDQVDYVGTLDLIRNFLPDARKIGYLLTRGESNALAVHRGFQSVALERGFEIVTATIGQATDIRPAAETLAPDVDLFLIGGDNTVASALDAVLNTALARNTPVFACDQESAVRGAIASLSVDYEGMGQRTADLCAILLAGADPNRIPVEQFVASRLIVNMKSASLIGLRVPENVVASADSLIR